MGGSKSSGLILGKHILSISPGKLLPRIDCEGKGVGPGKPLPRVDCEGKGWAPEAGLREEDDAA